MEQYDLDVWHMQRALELAIQGQGHVEPNPMVGCVIVQAPRSSARVGIAGLADPTRRSRHSNWPAAGLKRRDVRDLGALLPPGEDTPCTAAIVEAGIARVVIAHPDPFPRSTAGNRRAQRAGIKVKVGLLEAERAN